jgi:hypothetical protein
MKIRKLEIMNYLINLRILGIGILWSLSPSLLLAQNPIPSTPSTPETNIQPSSISNIDNLPGDAQQMRTWTCNRENQSVLVETKDVKIWTEIIDAKEWQCAEELSKIPDNAPRFSCESDNGDINIVTVTWLTEKADKQQMKTWINSFENQSMICTTDATNPFWN